jgi:hypothetical protein
MIIPTSIQNPEHLNLAVYNRHIIDTPYTIYNEFYSQIYITTHKTAVRLWMWYRMIYLLDRYCYIGETFAERSKTQNCTNS